MWTQLRPTSCFWGGKYGEVLLIVSQGMCHMFNTLFKWFKRWQRSTVAHNILQPQWCFVFQIRTHGLLSSDAELASLLVGQDPGSPMEKKQCKSESQVSRCFKMSWLLQVFLVPFNSCFLKLVLHCNSVTKLQAERGILLTFSHSAKAAGMISLKKHLTRLD